MNYDDRGNAMAPNKIAAGPSWAQAYLKPGDRSKKAVKEVWPEPKREVEKKRARPTHKEDASRRARVMQLSRDLRMTAIQMSEELNIPLPAMYRLLRKMVKEALLVKSIGRTENNVTIYHYSATC